LRRFEQRLRVEEVKDELVARFWNVVGIFRLGLIWFFSVVVWIGIWAATKDTSCETGIG
jgi:ABC-type dipeptide/oligopeptide/nickel transport system permease component